MNKAIEQTLATLAGALGLSGGVLAGGVVLSATAHAGSHFYVTNSVSHGAPCVSATSAGLSDRTQRCSQQLGFGFHFLAAPDPERRAWTSAQSDLRRPLSFVPHKTFRSACRMASTTNSTYRGAVALAWADNRITAATASSEAIMTPSIEAPGGQPDDPLGYLVVDDGGSERRRADLLPAVRRSGMRGDPRATQAGDR